MTFNIKSILVLAAAIVLVVVVRMCVFSVLTIPHDGENPVLLRGDRVLVRKWAYGLRRPFSRWGGYLRYRPRKAVRNDWMAFNYPAVEPDALPDTSNLCVGRVLACPGDTVWMGTKGHVSDHKDYRQGCIWPVVVPAKGMHVRVTPWSAPLYALVIRRHEGLNVSVVRDSLSVDSQLIGYFRFQRDYYWVASGNEDNLFDSRTFGFVPAEFVMGRVDAVLYSIDPTKPWTHCWRPDRTFKPIEKRE